MKRGWRVQEEERRKLHGDWRLRHGDLHRQSLLQPALRGLPGLHWGGRNLRGGDQRRRRRHLHGCEHLQRNGNLRAEERPGVYTAGQLRRGQLHGQPLLQPDLRRVSGLHRGWWNLRRGYRRRRRRQLHGR